MNGSSRVPPTQIVLADACTGSNSVFVKVLEPLSKCEKEEGLELCVIWSESERNLSCRLRCRALRQDSQAIVLPIKWSTLQRLD